MSRLQANCVLLLTSLIWGSTFVVQKTAFPDGAGGDLGPMLFSGLRFAIGALVVAPLAVREGRSAAARGERPLDRRDLAGFVLCGCFLLAGSYFQQVGIILTTVSNAGFLTALYVPLVPFLALLVFRRRPHWAVWPAVTAAVAGAYLLNDGALNGFGVGDLWVLLGAVFWGCHVTAVGVVVKRAGSPLRLAAVQFTVCGVVGLALGGASEAVTVQGISTAWFEIAYAGVLSVGLGFTLQVIGQNHTHPAAAAIIMSSEMLFAALGAAVVLGERLNGVQLAGASLILSGILLVEVLPLLKWSRQPRK